MTRHEFRKLYYEVLGTTYLRKEFWIRYREVLLNYTVDCAKYYVQIKGKEFMKQHMDNIEANWSDEEVKASKNNHAYWKIIDTPTVEFGNCKAATPCVTFAPFQSEWTYNYMVPKQEKGNNPMRIDNTTATAYVTAPKSDDAVSRDYLIDRLSTLTGYRDSKQQELRKLFNLDASDHPNTAEALIDAIKGDKFTFNTKKVARFAEAAEEMNMSVEDYMADYGYGPFYTLVFTDLPKADRKGYEAAFTEYEKQKVATKDIIMTAPPADGLKALQALETWLPVGKAN